MKATFTWPIVIVLGTLTFFVLRSVNQEPDSDGSERTADHVGDRAPSSARGSNPRHPAKSGSRSREQSPLEQVNRFTEKEVLAALRDIGPDGDQELIAALFSRLAILNPLKAIELAADTNPMPRPAVWLSEFQVERIVSKHRETMMQWVCSMEVTKPADDRIKMTFLTRISTLYPELAVEAFAARAEKFNESDRGRLPVALHLMLKSDPQKAFEICTTKYAGPAARDQNIQNMLVVGVPEEHEKVIEDWISQMPESSMKTAALNGLISGYKRRQSPKAAIWQERSNALTAKSP